MRLFIFAALVPIIAAPAFAQSGLQGKVVGCATIAEATQRLACFDAVALGLKQNGEAGFGTASPKPSALTAPVETALATNDAQEPDHVSLAVTAVSEGAGGKLRLTMENGQVWRQVDTTRLRNVGQGPWTAEIRKAALGSFMLTLNDGRPVRVERVK
jgi:hypothetical protein